MRIGVFGAGAVGGYYGSLLARAGEDVTFLVRPGRAATLRETGLIVHSVKGDFTVHPQLVTDIREAGRLDVVIVAIKNYHLTDAMDDLRELVASGAVLLPLLNGVRHIDHMSTQFGSDHVLGGSCYIEVTLNAAGHIAQTDGSCEIVFGALEHAEKQYPHLSDLLAGLQTAFVRADIPALRRQGILREMWKKYIFLSALSGVTAATRLPIGYVFRETKSKLLFSDMVKELIAVAKSKGIDLPADTHDIMMDRAAKRDLHMTSSMHRDLEKGLPLELDYLQGALVEMALEQNVPVPAHESVYAVLAPHRFGRVRL